MTDVWTFWHALMPGWEASHFFWARMLLQIGSSSVEGDPNVSRKKFRTESKRSSTMSRRNSQKSVKACWSALQASSTPFSSERRRSKVCSLTHCPILSPRDCHSDPPSRAWQDSSSADSAQSGEKVFTTQALNARKYKCGTPSHLISAREERRDVHVLILKPAQHSFILDSRCAEHPTRVREAGIIASCGIAQGEKQPNCKRDASPWHGRRLVWKKRELDVDKTANSVFPECALFTLPPICGYLISAT